MNLLERLKIQQGALENPNQKWVCGHLGSGKTCRAGPSKRGKCQANFECFPSQTGTVWSCRRPASEGGQCEEGPLPDGTCCRPIPKCKPIRTLRAKRQTASIWAALLAVGVLVLTTTYASNPQFLMPGPLSTAHSQLSKCSSCHSNIAEGNFGWLQAVFTPSNPHKDSQACLTCHKVMSNGLNPHGLELKNLKTYTDQLQTVAGASPMPASARIRSAVLPAERTFRDGVFCATCHKEHHGKRHDLNAMADAQCQNCHKVQFDSFYNGHPEFKSYPFMRRTRIFFDHSSHFKKHFPEILEKSTFPKSAIPGVCADCHTSQPDRRHMAVKTFAEICSACHIGQIVGTDRASGPKGIAVLSLPGLDIETLREKKADIGQWPEHSEAEVTPFMKLLIGTDEGRKKLLKQIGKLDLLDLTAASEKDIAAVEQFVWEIKGLYFELTTSTSSGIMKRLASATGAPVDAVQLSRLTALLPRDVLMNARREWLPKLNSEMEKRQDGNWKTLTKAKGTAARGTIESLSQAPAKSPKQAGKRLAQNSKNKKNSKSWRINEYGELIKGTENRKPRENEPEDKDDDPASDGPAADTAESDQDSDASGTSDQAAQQETEEDAGKTGVDAEAWAEFGGWYRQDYAILYKPTGHMDEFFHAWLDLTGPLYRPNEENFASSVFTLLTDKDAQGQCTKCHSVDAERDGSRRVNWMPSSVESKPHRFTAFVHEPHFNLVEEDGCLTCHKLNDANGHQDTYKANDPHVFVSNFKHIKLETCTECHTKNATRSDCLLCHNYHVEKITSPITSTKIPK